MAASKSVGGAVVVAFVFVIGTAAGYAVNEIARNNQTSELEQEISRLKDEVQRKSQADAPNEEEASAAIAKSGRSIRISECKPRQALPGVTCTGLISTTTGSFAGSTQPGMLSFAKIGGTWAQVQ